MTAVSINVGLISFGHSNPIMPTQRSVVGFYFREFVNHIGSESKWRNLAAHKFELQTLLPLRREKILAICFLGSEYYALNRPFYENGQKRFGLFFWPNFGVIAGSWGRFWLKCSPSIADWSLNVAYVSPHMKKFPLKKPKHIWAKIGQNPLNT